MSDESRRCGVPDVLDEWDGYSLSGVVLRLGILYGSRLTFLDVDAGATAGGGRTEECDATVDLGKRKD